MGALNCTLVNTLLVNLCLGREMRSVGGVEADRVCKVFMCFLSLQTQTRFKYVLRLTISRENNGRCYHWSRAREANGAASIATCASSSPTVDERHVASLSQPLTDRIAIWVAAKHAFCIPPDPHAAHRREARGCKAGCSYRYHAVNFVQGKLHMRN